MDIILHQEFDNKEPFLWSVDEIRGINLNLEEKDRLLKINDITIKWKYITNDNFLNFNFEIGKGINVIIFSLLYNNEKLIEFYDGLKKYDTHEYKIFICFTKECEHWGFHFKNENTLVNTFKKFTNIKLIWDSPFYTTKTLIFSPKITLHSYFNNIKSRIEAFYWGRNAFDEITKEYRIGLHVNKITDIVRIFLCKSFYEKSNDGLFFTSSRDCPTNLKNMDMNHNYNSYLANYNSPQFDVKIRKPYDNGVRENWYTLQFLEQTIKSSIEIVYESWTHTVIDSYNIKLTEKTLKHLYLGKPFIHADPFAHQTLIKNNIKPYKPLFTPELWEFYENWDVNKKPDYSYLELLEKNINWLLDLPDHLFNNILQECTHITSENRNYVDKILFHTTLIDIIKSNL